MQGNIRTENSKTLGRAAAEILLRLSEQGKPIFSVEDAQAIYNKSRKVTSNLLGKLVRKGWLVRLMRGKYLVVPLEAGLDAIPMADRYVIAREMLGSTEYYISHYIAMEVHQMPTQPVNTVYVTVSRQRHGRVIAGTQYYFVYASSKSFWGWENIWATPQEQVRVSDLEKTLLDGAVRPELCGGVGDMAKGLWLRKDELDEDRLLQYAKRLDHKAAARRVGFLLTTYGLGRPETLATLQGFGIAGYDLLDPTLPDDGPHDRRWRLRINLDAEELRGSVWT
jgi:predicted transcriptional regulator of viral defense system